MSELPSPLGIRPRGNRVLVQPEPLEARVGVIHIPETVYDNPKSRTDYRPALVLAVGPGKWLSKAQRYEPIPFQVGDRVMVNAWMGDAVRVGDVPNDPKAPMLIDADDVAGVVEPE